MTTFKQFLVNDWFLESVKYDYWSVQIPIDSSLNHKILLWGDRHIDDEVLFNTPDDPGFGREDESHITILYGIHTSNVKTIKEILSKTKPFEVELDKISLFENKKFNVVKIDVLGKDLYRLNQKLKNELDYSDKYPEFKPHLTIAYVKKDFGKTLINDKTFKGIKFEVNNLIFSATDKKHKINLS